MAKKTLTEAEKKFLAFDWSKSTQWQTYYSNLYPTPDATKIPKFKRTWFRRNVDSSLPEDSTVGDPEPTKKAAPDAKAGSKTASNNAAADDKNAQATTMPKSPLFDKYKSTRPKISLLKEFVLRLELVLLIGFVFATSIVITSRFKAPGTENLVRNSITISKLFFVLFLILRLLRDKGMPKFSMDYVNSISNSQHMHYLMYAVSFLSVSPQLFVYVPELITALLYLSGLYKEYPTLFPRLLQTQKVKELLSKVDQNGYLLCKVRAHLEIAMLPYLVLTGFMSGGSARSSSMVPLFLYVSFIKFKLNSKDVYMMNTLKNVHLKITTALNNPNVPNFVRALYVRVVKSLEMYFTGRRR